MSDRKVVMEFEFNTGSALDDGVIDEREADQLYAEFDRTVRTAERELAKLLAPRPLPYIAPMPRVDTGIDPQRRNRIFALIVGPSLLAAAGRLVWLLL